MTDPLHRGDEDALIDMLITRDIAAFVRADWPAVAGDFDEDAFVGYSGSAPDGLWTLAYPTLDAYRDEWLSQAGELGGSPDLSTELGAAQRIAGISIVGDKGMVRKEFDGIVNSRSGPARLHWTTYYFVRRDQRRWRITGFVGFLPPARAVAQ